MASQGQPTRVQPPPPPPPPPQGGLDLQTLALTAVASAVAAYVTAQLWAPGALGAAAMSPVIVALVREGLRKPTEVVSAVVPTRVGARGRTRETSALPADVGEQLELGAPPPYPPPQPGAQEGPVTVYSTRGSRLRWRLAVVTGLLGFAICVVLFTVPDLITGSSIAGSGHRTTLFQGGRHHRSTSTTPATTTTTPAATQTTPAPTATQPAQTVTQTVTTPAPAPAPSTSTPPATTAPAPADAGTATTPGG